MKYEITHTTEYRYSESVSHCHNELYMTPRDTDRQSLVRASIDINPAPCDYTQRVDVDGNQFVDFAIYKPHQSLSIVAKSVVDVSNQAAASSSLESMNFQVARDLMSDNDAYEKEGGAKRFVEHTVLTERDPLIQNLADTTFAPGKSYLEALLDLNQKIYSDFEYQTASSNVQTTASEVIRSRSGVCQDFAHLAIACLRTAGIPARYVSGYLETQPAPGVTKLIGADASHAWIAAFVPGYGWLELDPTNNMLADNRHIVTAWGMDYTDVAPLKGVISGGGSNEMNVSVDVRCVD